MLLEYQLDWIKIVDFLLSDPVWLVQPVAKLYLTQKKIFLPEGVGPSSDKYLNPSGSVLAAPIPGLGVKCTLYPNKGWNLKMAVAPTILIWFQ